ncbi:Mannan endo-1,6-alpha-mannosidase DCW1 [Yarrowia sp. B02]|nr:Mannan endo-1,6-alpha-mannosidase DCW1 [Yarrowia sp. B02]
MKFSRLISNALIALTSVCALTVDIDDPDSIAQNAALIAQGLMNYYDGHRYGGVVGMFVFPYYWWEAGAAWNSMLDFWYYTGNDTYNDVVKEALLYQVGKNNDYLPVNQSTTEGNDDQGFWGITAMAAAEKNFSNPGKDEPQWLYLAQAVFNTMSARWDTDHCNGGLRWQIYTWNNGYDYKNTVSNGCLFHLAARLYRYTGNDTYLHWAEKAWDWCEQSGLLNKEDNYHIRDGVDVNNCSNITPYVWTYNAGLFIGGSAFLYNATSDDTWATRAKNIWTGCEELFFQDDKMVEISCQQSRITCNNDQRCFKAIFSRFIGYAALFLPDIRDDIMKKLRASAIAALQTCSGGSDGHTCSIDWLTGAYSNDWIGLGEQMSALEVLQNNLIFNPKMAPNVTTNENGTTGGGIGPLTHDTGGTSEGSPDAGSSSANPLLMNLDIKGSDKAGAGVLTAVLLIGVLGSGWWMLA